MGVAGDLARNRSSVHPLECVYAPLRVPAFPTVYACAPHCVCILSLLCVPVCPTHASCHVFPTPINSILQAPPTSLVPGHEGA